MIARATIPAPIAPRRSSVSGPSGTSTRPVEVANSTSPYRPVRRADREGVAVLAHLDEAQQVLVRQARVGREHADRGRLPEVVLGLEGVPGRGRGRRLPAELVVLLEVPSP